MVQEQLKSLTKALEILKLFLVNKNEMTLAEISEFSGLPKATVYRIVSVLTTHNYLQQDGKRSKYSLGTIYSSYYGIMKKSIHIRDIAKPHLIDLSRLANEGVVLAFKDPSGNVFSETFCDPAQNNILKIDIKEGIGMPLHNTCLGKIILSEMSDEELKKYFNHKELLPSTPNTITNISELKRQLKKIRREGVAFDNEESALGVRGVGSGIRNEEGTLVGAAGIVAPSIRLSRSKMRGLVSDVKNCNMEISKELGFIEKSLKRRSP